MDRPGQHHTDVAYQEVTVESLGQRPASPGRASTSYSRPDGHAAKQEPLQRNRASQWLDVDTGKHIVDCDLRHRVA